VHTNNGDFLEKTDEEWSHYKSTNYDVDSTVFPMSYVITSYQRTNKHVIVNMVTHHKHCIHLEILMVEKWMFWELTMTDSGAFITYYGKGCTIILALFSN